MTHPSDPAPDPARALRRLTLLRWRDRMIAAPDLDRPPPPGADAPAIQRHRQRQAQRIRRIEQRAEALR